MSFTEFVDLSSPKFKNKNYACLKASEVTQFFEDDDGTDSISVISEDTTVSDNFSTHSSESETRRRSARNTPVRNILSNSETNRNSSSQRRENDIKTEQESYRVKKRDIGDKSLKVNVTRLQRIDNSIEFDTLGVKTPDRKRASRLDSNHEQSASVKKCRTEPRRKSLAILPQETAVRQSPRSDRKVRRAQSVLLKKVGSQYQSFRNPTPDSEGRKTRTRLSEKFETCEKTEEVRRSAREAFNVITNKQDSVKKSPKPRAARRR